MSGGGCPCRQLSLNETSRRASEGLENSIVHEPEALENEDRAAHIPLPGDRGLLV
jgi:hypothetical protein